MDKPIIRHCRNCKYCEDRYRHALDRYSYIYCQVKYKNIEFERLSALTCIHYKAKKRELN